MNHKVLITGANRGIGLALVREYLSRGDFVAAACRHPDKAAELSQLRPAHPDRFAILRLDVNSDQSVQADAGEVAEHFDGLDVLVNNAGVFGGKPATLADIRVLDFRDTYETNVIGTFRVTRACLPILKRGRNARVVNVSSEAGMISRPLAEPRYYAYGASKAALNYITRALAKDLLADGISVVALSPGWVRTDMGGPEAPLSVEESARGIVKVVHGLTIRDAGRWFRHDGSENEMW